MHLYLSRDLGAKSADTDVMGGDADASTSIRSRRVGCQEDT